MGDAWSWFAIDADTKMILSHKTGKRDQSACDTFLRRLNNATTGRIQVTSDGFACYTYAVPTMLGSRVDFAQLIKTYQSSQSETRYSPATITGIEIVPRFGNSNEERISTSFAERFNLSVRMHNRRLTRLTNAHSKSFEHHDAVISLFTAYYKFCRKHESLGERVKDRKTPAMAAGLAGHVWSIEELLAAAA
jgi:IS1 family transposase